MAYDEIDMASFCGNCHQQFAVDKAKCPNCSSYLVNYNVKTEGEKRAMERWKSRNNK